MSTVTKGQVRKWMWENAELDDYGEVNLAVLAEAAAQEFNHDEWLDDEQHWVWDIAFGVGQRIENREG